MNATETITMDDFEGLYAKFGPMVLRRCRHLLKDEDRALDAMQDTFVRVMERRERITAVCSSFFYTVATTVCLNKIRSDRLRRGPSMDVLEDLIADGKTAFHEEQTDTELFLDRLFSDTREDTRCMAVIHYLDGLTLEETARIMCMSVSGVRKRLTALRTKAIESIGE
jgi:RNA polymerase sigma-70 factor (ECF subfamily)